MRVFILFCTLAIAVQANQKLANQECQACHPKIYKEYQGSHHAKASIYKDEIFSAIWKKHPLSKENNFKCKKCHTPSDHELMSGKSKLAENKIQLTEPISCQTCHTIKDVQKHAKANKNIFTDKKKTFYAADEKKKGTKLEFKEESSFFGMFSKTVGSPYHDIDYSNENYYTGNSCMGCHSHKQNGKEFVICDLEVKKSESGDNCISCHMPKVEGSLANQKPTKTHAFHGVTSLTLNPKLLSKYILLDLKKGENGFNISLQNVANHTLVPHPLRLAKLKVTIQRGGKTIEIEPKTFVKVIGTNGKPAMPWLANSIIKDTSIKAFETRDISFDTTLEKGDIVTVEFGYHIVNPKIAKKLQLKDESLSKFVILTKKRFTI
jgi:hypothetical protein